MSIETAGLWVSAIFTLGIYSFLYKENPLYRLAEHLVVGISSGYGIAITWTRVIQPRLIDPIVAGESGAWVLLIPAALGILYITRFFPNVAWLSRYPLAFIMGASMGVGFPLSMKAQVLRQLEATIIPLYQPGLPWDVAIGNIVIVLGTSPRFFTSSSASPTRGPSSEAVQR